MRMGKRLPGLQAIAKNMLQLAADAGSVWAGQVLKMDSQGDTVATMKAIGADLRKGMEVIAGATIGLHERVTVIEQQPAPAGILTRSAGSGAVRKAIGVERDRTPAPVDQQGEIARLQRLVAIEVNPSIRAGYIAQLASLTK